MKIHKIITPSMEENIYIIYDEKSKDALIIDPGNKNDSLNIYLKENELTPILVLLTHGHFDHIYGIPKLRENYKINIIAHKEEKIVLNTPSYNYSNTIKPEIYLDADQYIDDADQINFYNLSFKVLFTPGHTPGGVCYYCEQLGAVFSGDTLFKGFIGRCDLYKGDEKQLISGIKNKLFTLPLDTVVYSGHGDETTIGQEIENNIYCK